jgi:L-threonylcarbamoyladenylate synthase
MITAPMLRALLGEIAEGAAETTVARSPGQMLRHYAPTVPLLVIPGAEIRSRLQKGDGLLAHSADFWQYRYPPMGTDGIVQATLPMPADAAEYAAQLYKALRTIDAMRVARILVEEPPHGEEWTAIHDRLRRAAAPKNH